MKLFKNDHIFVIVALLDNKVIRRCNNSNVDFRSFYSQGNIKSYVLLLKHVNHKWVFRYVNYTVEPLSLTFCHRHPKVKSQTFNGHMITSQT